MASSHSEHFVGGCTEKRRDRSTHNHVSQKLSLLIRSSAQTCKRWWLQTLFSSLWFLLQRWLCVSESCWNMIFVKLWGTHSLTTADNADSVQQAENSIYNADCRLKDCPQFTERGGDSGHFLFTDFWGLIIILIYFLYQLYWYTIWHLLFHHILISAKQTFNHSHCPSVVLQMAGRTQSHK